MAPTATMRGLVRITVNGRAKDYLLAPVPSDYGIGFQLESAGLDGDGAAYAVCLDSDKTSCECPGFLKWNRCKHTDGLAALVAAARKDGYKAKVSDPKGGGPLTKERVAAKLSEFSDEELAAMGLSRKKGKR
jgi:hypothetical protein